MPDPHIQFKNEPEHAFIAGIDPGSKGAVAFIEPFACKLMVINLPIMTESGGTRKHTYVDHVELATILRSYAPAHSYAENVHTTPQMGVVSAGTFMRNFGTIIGVHGGLFIPLTYVTPQVWKANLQVPADKKEAVGRARSLLPDCAHLFTRPDLAEAALIALYGVMRQNYRLTKRITPLEL